MAEQPPPSKPKGGGCLSKLFFLLLLATVGGIGTAVFFVTRPQDLSDLGGYGPAAHTMPVRDMAVVLKNSIDRDFPVTLTEAEVNGWLAKTLQAKQGGMAEGKVTLERVWVRLEEGRAEVIMERKIFGAPSTLSMYLQVERMQEPREVVTHVRMDGGPFHPSLPSPPRGGRFGQLVIPQGFLRLVMPAYAKLAAVYEPELDLALREMQRIKISKGQVVLDPREPLGENGMPTTF